MVSRITKTKRREIVDELHGAGLRATPARVAVLDAVRQASAPLTHAELTRELDGNGWDAATIYRNLVAITDAGLIVRSDHGDRRWRFEDRPSDGATEHQHPLPAGGRDPPAADPRPAALRGRGGVRGPAARRVRQLLGLAGSSRTIDARAALAVDAAGRAEPELGRAG